MQHSAAFYELIENVRTFNAERKHINVMGNLVVDVCFFILIFLGLL